MAQIKADEITQLLREQIANYDSKVQVDEVGTITSLGDGIARLHGLDKVMAGELLAFPHGIAGLALSLEEDSVGSVILGEYTELSEGDEVKRTGKILSVPVGEGMIGRVVNALGQPIDDKGPIASTSSLPIERIAPGIVDRQPVREPMATGLKAIDAMIPIGRGQRELIIGDGLAERVHHAADHGVADGHAENLAGALDLIAFAHFGVVAQKNAADLILFEAHGQTGNAVGKLQQLAGHDFVEAVEARDAITQGDYRADFVDAHFRVVVGDLLLQERCNFVCFNLRHACLFLVLL